MSISSQTLAWLRQSAAVDGAAYSQVLLHLLERVEVLEADATEQSQSSSFCNEAIVRRLEALEAANHFVEVPKMVPTPDAAPLATDEDLWAVADQERFDLHARRAVYNLGRQHGAAQPPAAQPAPAPAGGLVERVAHVIGDDPLLLSLWEDDARAAIREVAAWAGQLGLLRTERKLREEAGR